MNVLVIPEDFRGDEKVFLGENAWQEVEVWVLAGLDDLPKEWKWQEIRSERDPKEHYFAPYLSKRGLSVEDLLGQGRKKLAKEAAQKYSRIRQLCKEDVAALEQNLRNALKL